MPRLRLRRRLGAGRMRARPPLRRLTEDLAALVSRLGAPRPPACTRAVSFARVLWNFSRDRCACARSSHQGTRANSHTSSRTLARLRAACLGGERGGGRVTKGASARLICRRSVLSGSPARLQVRLASRSCMGTHGAPKPLRTPLRSAQPNCRGWGGGSEAVSGSPRSTR